MEESLTLQRLAQRLDVNYRTVWRWYRIGARSESGGLVKLETTKGTSGRETTMALYERFKRGLQA